MINANETPYQIMNDFPDIFNNLTVKDLFRYPDSYDRELRKAISNYVKQPMENIICGNGADQVLSYIIKAYVDIGDHVVVHSPSFEMYSVLTQMNGGQVHKIKDIDDRIDVEGLIKASNKYNAKLIFLCTPNNPTGYMLQNDEIQNIIDGTNSIIVLDEAYIEFSNKDHLNFLKNNRIIIIRTFSKAFGLAALRLGYGIANGEIMEDLNIVKPPYSINKLTQSIGKFAMDHRDTILEYRLKIIEERNRMYCNLKKLKGVEALPSEGNFIYIRSSDIKRISDQLLTNGILPRIYFGNNKDVLGLRITITTEDINDMVFNQIKEAIYASR